MFVSLLNEWLHGWMDGRHIFCMCQEKCILFPYIIITVILPILYLISDSVDLLLLLIQLMTLTWVHLSFNFMVQETLEVH